MTLTEDINNDNLIAEPVKDLVVPVELSNVMSSSYIEYAMSVIVSRALPDVRDGLKPVHRRILYAMQEAGMTSSNPYKKSARIVGEVLGKYHPHGDSSVYDAIVRMAQDFSIRYALADGHGNFGSVDGDSAAAMRYTEVRMSKVAELMLQDIDKNTVDFIPNYDESLQEPSVLPSKFPQLLVNGSDGIAVGMATKIPPHNMREVIDGVLMLIDDPEVTIDELMTKIQGPDFPTGGNILGRAGIESAYKTGRGIIAMRAETKIDTMANGKPRIIVTELPFQVNKARLVEKIAELVRDKTIDGITALRDESDRNGMRVVIELRRDANANVLLNQLFKHTQMQETFGAILLALVDNQPKILNLKEMLYYYIQHQKEVLTRRTQFELNKASARAHILEGLEIALKNLDQVIAIIRQARTTEIAKNDLLEKFPFSDKQVQAILDLKLQRLTGLEREKIDDEYKNLLRLMEKLKAILADEKKIFALMKKELRAVKEKFGDDRRTRLLPFDSTEMQSEDLIAKEDIVITLTHGGYIKRINLNTYRNQRRGGRGVTGMGTKETDFVENLLITTTHHTILFFTNRGRVYRLKGYEIAESSRQTKGTAIVNLLPIETNGGEKITAIIPLSENEYSPERFLFMATKKGIVKRTSLDEFSNIRKSGLIALTLDDDDELISVQETDGTNAILLGTRHGLVIAFEENDVRNMKRPARGVIGIRLKKGDVVVGMAMLNSRDEILTVTSNGLGKRTDRDSYRIQKRGGQGVMNIRRTKITGDVIGVQNVHADQEIVLITQNGIVLRTNIDQISVIGRVTQGVKVIRVDEADEVASMAVVNSGRAAE